MQRFQTQKGCERYEIEMINTGNVESWNSGKKNSNITQI